MNDHFQTLRLEVTRDDSKQIIDVSIPALVDGDQFAGAMVRVIGWSVPLALPPNHRIETLGCTHPDL